MSDRPARATRDVRPDVRPDVRAAPVSSEEEKKTRGVRGAAAPRLNPSREEVWGGEAPQPKFGGSGGQRPPAKIFSKISFLGFSG